MLAALAGVVHHRECADTVTSTTATMTMTKGLFIVTSPPDRSRIFVV
jgi:hypothetical protein